MEVVYYTNYPLILKHTIACRISRAPLSLFFSSYKENRPGNNIKIIFRCSHLSHNLREELDIIAGVYSHYIGIAAEFFRCRIKLFPDSVFLCHVDAYSIKSHNNRVTLDLAFIVSVAVLLLRFAHWYSIKRCTLRTCVKNVVSGQRDIPIFSKSSYLISAHIYR